MMISRSDKMLIVSVRIWVIFYINLPKLPNQNSALEKNDGLSAIPVAINLYLSNCDSFFSARIK